MKKIANQKKGSFYTHKDNLLVYLAESDRYIGGADNFRETLPCGIGKIKMEVVPIGSRLIFWRRSERPPQSESTNGMHMFQNDSTSNMTLLHEILYWPVHNLTTRNITAHCNMKGAWTLKVQQKQVR